MELLGIKWTPVIKQISELHKWDKNPRKILEVAYARLKKKILEEGMHQVLTIDTDNTVLSGNQRLEILKEVGVEEVWCMQPNRALTEEERDKVGIQSNIIEGSWDTDMLANNFEIPMLLAQGFTKLQLGMGDLEEDNWDESKEMGKITSPIPQTGDIYQLGEHRLMCGDSTKLEDVEKLMDGQKAHLIFTDPPYMVNYHSPAGNTYKSKKYGGDGGAIFNDNLDEEHAREFFTKVLKNLYAVSTDDVCIYWWFANRNNHINRLAFIDTGWKMSQIIVWIKNSMIFAAGQDYHRQYEPCMFGWKEGKTHFKNKMYAKFKDVYNLEFTDFSEMFNVWYERRDNTQDYIHPTQKPVRLADRALKKHSEVQDIVVDLFAGSGSTLIGCEMGQRRCFTLEMDPKYVHAVIKRFMKYRPDVHCECLTRAIDMAQFKD